MVANCVLANEILLTLFTIGAYETIGKCNLGCGIKLFSNSEMVLIIEPLNRNDEVNPDKT